MSHVGFIVPLIMISSTVQGFQKAAEQKIARKGWLHALTAIFVTSGCALFAYTVLSLFIQQGECVAIVGDVATCACTRMYWSQGFLAPTNCTWEKIETFECHHATVMKDSQVGPAERKRFRFHADIDSEACVPGRKCILH